MTFGTTYVTLCVLILPLYEQQLTVFAEQLLRTESAFQFKYAIFFTKLLNFYHLSLAFCVLLAVSFICTRQQLIENLETLVFDLENEIHSQR